LLPMANGTPAMSGGEKVKSRKFIVSVTYLLKKNCNGGRAVNYNAEKIHAVLMGGYNGPINVSGPDPNIIFLPGIFMKNI